MANRVVGFTILLAFSFIGGLTYAAKCDSSKYENTKFFGKVLKTLTSIQSDNDCASACFDLKQGRPCKSANYYKQTRKCELLQDDAFEPIEGSYHQEDSSCTYLVQIRCDASAPSPQPQPQPQPQPKPQPQPQPQPQPGNLKLKYEPMNCQIWNYAGTKYQGKLEMTLDKVESAAICPSLCWQINQQGRKCNSTNYLIKEKRCEFFQDELIHGMLPGSTYEQENENSIYFTVLKCFETGPENNNSLPNMGNTNNIRPGSCGQTAVPPKKTRIVGGFEARRNSIPWIVSLRYHPSDYHLCGGTLIRVRADREESDIVVTAAHCTVNKDLNFNATVGAHFRFGAIAGEQSQAVQQKIEHPDYSKEADYAYDVAVLKLVKPIKFSNTVQPACLPAKNEEPAPGTLGIVAGWGALEESGASSGALMEVTVPVIERESCRRMYQGVYTIVPDVMLCGGYERGQQDSCQGDSGGPYFFNGKNGFTLQGIVSFGAGCARERSPGVYARVTKLIDWIQDQVKSMSTVYRS